MFQVWYMHFRSPTALLSSGSMYRQTKEAQQSRLGRDNGVVAPSLEKYIGAESFSSGEPLPEFLKKYVATRYCGVADCWELRIYVAASLIMGIVMATIPMLFLRSDVDPDDGSCTFVAVFDSSLSAVVAGVILGLFCLFPVILLTDKGKLQVTLKGKFPISLYVNFLFWLYIEDACARFHLKYPRVVVHSFSFEERLDAHTYLTRHLTIFSDGSHACVTKRLDVP